MANPQPTDAHIKIAHSITEAIMMRDFTKRQRKVLDLVLRLSWGCGKKEACIPKLNDFEIVGVRNTHIKAEVDWLASAQVISIQGTQYSFNKDFDQWKVSLVMPYSPKRMKELIHINLNGYQNGNKVTETVSYQNGNKVTTKVTSELPKQELLGYHGGNLDEPTPESAKESIKELLKKDNTIPIVPYGEFSNVLLTKDEFDKLVLKFGESKTKELIERLSTGIASKGYKYKSHYATILNWDNLDKKKGLIDGQGGSYGGKKSGIHKPGYSTSIPKHYNEPEDVFGKPSSSAEEEDPAAEGGD